MRRIISAFEKQDDEGDEDQAGLLSELSRLAAGKKSPFPPSRPLQTGEANTLGRSLNSGERADQDAGTSALEKQRKGDAGRLDDIPVKGKDLEPGQFQSAIALKGRPAEAKLADSVIRVDVALLDQLMTLVSELVLARNQLLQKVISEGDGTIDPLTQTLNRVTTDLHERFLKT